MEQLFTVLLTFLLLSCNNNRERSSGLHAISDTNLNPYKQIKAIPLPDGFKRIKDETGSFTGFLRNVNLKENTTVHLFNGQPKRNQSAQYALLDI